MLVIIKKNENQVNNEILLHRILIKIALIKKQTKVEKCLQGCEEIVAARRSYPMSEVRDGSQEELPACPRTGAVAERRLAHAQGQGRQPRGATPHPKSSVCAGPGGRRGATPLSRSGRAVVRRNLSSKVRSSGCALLEQP